MEFYCDEAIAVATLNKLNVLVVVRAGHFYVHTESHNYVIYVSFGKLSVHVLQ